jgi:hypothetical protein
MVWGSCIKRYENYQWRISKATPSLQELSGRLSAHKGPLSHRYDFYNAERAGAIQPGISHAGLLYDRLEWMAGTFEE